MTKLTPLPMVPDYVVIIRCIHCRGKAQNDALNELAHRGLWLTREQLTQAGLLAEHAGEGEI